MANFNFFQTSSPKYLLLVKCQFILLSKSSGGFHHTYTNTEINGASLLSICLYLRQLAHSNLTHKTMAGSRLSTSTNAGDTTTLITTNQNKRVIFRNTIFLLISLFALFIYLSLFPFSSLYK